MVSIDSSQVRALHLDLTRAPLQVQRQAVLAVKRTLFAIEADGKVLAPVDTGTLEGSISTDVDPDGLGGEVGPTVDYGDDVEHGTQPHVIRPRDAGALRFVAGGGVVFAGEVHHPGTAPQPFMGPAFDRQAPGLDRALGNAGEDIL